LYHERRDGTRRWYRARPRVLVLSTYFRILPVRGLPDQDDPFAPRHLHFRRSTIIRSIINQLSQDATLPSTDDPYEPNAELYDLLGGPLREPQRGALAAALRGAPIKAGPVLDLGAGTGLSTALISAALPDAEIVAVEPSRALRAVLMSRIAGDSALRRAVTVLPFSVEEAQLPARLAGAVALGVIGHFDAAGVDRLLTRLAAALVPGAPFVVELQPPEEPIAVPRSRFARERVGQLVYEGWQQAEPAGPDVLRWTMTFRTLRDGQPIAETVAEHPYRTVGRDELAAVARRAGLQLEPADAGLVVLHADR